MLQCGLMNRLRLALAITLIALGTSCYKVQNHGKGKCHEYRPACLGSNHRCTIDDRGCEMCTCEGEALEGQHEFPNEPGVYDH